MSIYLENTDKNKCTWQQYIKRMALKTSPAFELENDFLNQYIPKNFHLHSLFNYNVPLVYLLDYTTGNYVMINGCVKNLLGYDQEDFLQGGVAFTMDCFEPDQLKVFNSRIFSDRLGLLKKIDPSYHPDYVFSNSLALRSKSNNYINLLQRSIFIKSDVESNPLLSLGIILNLGPYCPEGIMTQRMEKLNACDEGIPEIIFCENYHPYGLDKLFTPREKEILNWLSEGLTSKQIAAKLFICEGTVILHRKSMLKKCGVPNVAALISYSVKNKII